MVIAKKAKLIAKENSENKIQFDIIAKYCLPNRETIFINIKFLFLGKEVFLVCENLPSWVRNKWHYTSIIDQRTV